MTTRDMFQVLINGQDALKKNYDSLKYSIDELKQSQNTLENNHHLLTHGIAELKQSQDALKEELALLREETRDGFRKTHERLDMQGKQLAYLEDDAPTREEHEGLVKKIEKVEKIVSS